jgi:hypothetical protein
MRYYLDSAKLSILPYILGFDILTVMEERVRRSWRLGMKEGLAGWRLGGFRAYLSISLYHRAGSLACINLILLYLF